MSVKTGQVLQTFIKGRRITIKEISKGSGVPASTIGEWANNRIPKNPVQVKKVAAFLGISTHFLLFGEEDKQDLLQKVLTEDLFSGTFEINIKRVRVK